MPEQRCLHCGAVAYSLECGGWCRLCGSAEVVTAPGPLEPLDPEEARAALDACDLLACSED